MPDAEGSAVVRITRLGLESPAGGPAVAALGATFARAHLLRLPGFFADDLLRLFDERLSRGRFEARVERGVIIERQLADPALLAVMAIVLNDPALFRVVEDLTGCGGIGCFTGRVYERQGVEQSYGWHSDCIEDRLVALSVNLSAAPFRGGALQVRRAGEAGVLAEVRHRHRGDAALVRIHPDLEHRVTPVTSDTPRLVVAGWFRRAPAFRDLAGLRAGRVAEPRDTPLL